MEKKGINYFAALLFIRARRKRRKNNGPAKEKKRSSETELTQKKKATKGTYILRSARDGNSTARASGHRSNFSSNPSFPRRSTKEADVCVRSRSVAPGEEVVANTPHTSYIGYTAQYAN